jgi:hypothetical protein
MEKHRRLLEENRGLKETRIDKEEEECRKD